MSSPASASPSPPLEEVISIPPSSSAAAPAAAAAEAPSYYWERATAVQPSPAAPDVVTLLTHNLHYYTWQVLGGIEFIGEVLSDAMGLMNSRYEWALQAERNRMVRGEREGPAAGVVRVKGRGAGGWCVMCGGRVWKLREGQPHPCEAGARSV